MTYRVYYTALYDVYVLRKTVRFRMLILLLFALVLIYFWFIINLLQIVSYKTLTFT